MVEASGVSDVCSSVCLGCVLCYFVFLWNPGNMLRTEPQILLIVPGLFASFTKILCSLGSAT